MNDLRGHFREPMGNLAPANSARRVVTRLAVGMLFGTGFLVSVSLGADSRDDETSIDFARDVQPIFARACQKCHGPQKLRGGLRLDERASALAGGDSGEPAVTPGDVKASQLVDRVSTDDASQRMPPKANGSRPAKSRS